VAACAYILYNLQWYTWIAFTGWVTVALIFYLVWGRRHSALNDGANGSIPTAEPIAADLQVAEPPKDPRSRFSGS
jgi:hypothetical protein